MWGRQWTVSGHWTAFYFTLQQYHQGAAISANLQWQPLQITHLFW